MKYKIVEINDLAGKKKTDEGALKRIGRTGIVQFYDTYSSHKHMYFLADNKGEKLDYYGFITSRVKDVIQENELMLVLTENSTYVLEEVPCY